MITLKRLYRKVTARRAFDRPRRFKFGRALVFPVYGIIVAMVVIFSVTVIIFNFHFSYRCANMHSKSDFHENLEGQVGFLRG